MSAGTFSILALDLLLFPKRSQTDGRPLLQFENGHLPPRVVSCWNLLVRTGVTIL